MEVTGERLCVVGSVGLVLELAILTAGQTFPLVLPALSLVIFGGLIKSKELSGFFLHIPATHQVLETDVPFVS